MREWAEGEAEREKEREEFMGRLSRVNGAPRETQAIPEKSNPPIEDNFTYRLEPQLHFSAHWCLGGLLPRSPGRVFSFLPPGVPAYKKQNASLRLISSQPSILRL